LTLFASLLAWGGYLRNRGLRQHRAALAIQHESNIVLYDYQFDAAGTFVTGPTPKLPNTLLDRLLGPYAFRQIKQITLGSHFSDQHARHLADLFSLQQLDLSHRSITDQSLEYVRRLSRLRELDLAGTPITDAGFLRLASLHDIRRLDASSTGITDVGLEILHEFPHLESLRLYDTAITDAGLSCVSGCRHLQRLDLSRTRVSDAGLDHLQNLTDLRALQLSDTDVSPEGLARFDGVKQLDSLDFSWGSLGIRGVIDLICKHHGQSLARALCITRHAQVSRSGRVTDVYLPEFGVTDDLVAELSELRSLRNLDLSGNPITDVAIPHLLRLRGLRHLDISGTRITDEGVELLRRELSGCQVW
jgi:Leucine-rich repeat (LRR) protein